MNAALTRGERQDLLQVVRQRERVAKAAAAERAAQLRADFETQLDTKYQFDTNDVWKAAHEKAQVAAAEAQAAVAAECQALGIPPEFAPTVASPIWFNRGQNMVKERRTELRRLAHVQIEAEIIATGLSQAGLAFLANLPSADAMMPVLVVAEVERLLPSKRER